jgi:predicted aspartyl protease
MSLFYNGHAFKLAPKCSPPVGYPVPFVMVRMRRPFGPPHGVVGKVDTGAARTMLTFEQARALGIEHPESSTETGVARTATGQPFAFYLHDVLVEIPVDVGQTIRFPLKAAFAQELKRNLFGLDWLASLCLAVDRQAVHFLRD